ncbi:hypothetical protein BC828DRAFT_377892 [Blastocladiella britannica]|nr:hypothetical protein BC828DRAFT_377892 [Blastocladiella britannica]
MDHEAEQQNEVEILKSIYFEEFIELEGGNVRQYALKVTPDESELALASLLPAENDFISAGYNLYLTVDVPEDYPESLPTFDVLRTPPASLEGDSDNDGDNAHDDSDEDEYDDGDEEEDLDPNHPLYLSDVDLEAFAQAAADAAAPLVGEPVVFTVVTALKEEIARVAAVKVFAARAADEERIRKEDEADNAKFRGTPVTPERFVTWKKAFDLERAKAKAKAAAADAPKNANAIAAAARAALSKTGRKLFEHDKSLAQSDTRFMGEDEESVDPKEFHTEAASAELARLNLDEDEDNGVAALLLQDRE